MASNLLKAGHDLTVFDVSEAAVGNIMNQGAKVAKSPSEVAGSCDTIITMLPSTSHVEDVYSRILDTVSSGSLLIDSSTIEPSATKKLSQQAAEKGTFMIDAPVSGGVGGAKAGSLTFMVGGTRDALSLATPTLEVMGKNIVHCGGSCKFVRGQIHVLILL